MPAEPPDPPRSRIPGLLFGREVPEPLLRRFDLRVTVGLLGGFVATLPVPRRLDPWLAGQLVSLFMRLRPRKVESAEATIRRGLGPRADQFDMAEITRRFYEGKVEYALGRARGLWPRRWEPQIEVDGREYVDQALAEGRGAILWRIDMTDTTVLQRGAWQSGWPLVQLSSIIHGVTNSQLGMRVTAPLYARPENAYLVERVRIPADWSFGYMPRLIRALKANQVVAILGEVVARQNVTVSILEGTRPIPTGAPAIAHRTGAALIPAATFREGPLRYRLQLGPPIEVDQSLPRREATEQAVLEFGRRIEQAVAEHPSDWLGWWRLHLNENGPAPAQAMA